MATLPKVDLGPTLGVGYIGVSISSMYVMLRTRSHHCISFAHARSCPRQPRSIYGVACLQTFQYYLSSKAKTDRKELHVLVRVFFSELADVR